LAFLMPACPATDGFLGLSLVGEREREKSDRNPTRNFTTRGLKGVWYSFIKVLGRNKERTQTIVKKTLFVRK
jgi:hypothetical protein